MVSIARLSICMLLLSAPIAHAQTSGWHVPKADLRFGLVIDGGWRGPADIFLADLPIQAGKELAFDRATKQAKPSPSAAKDKQPMVQGEAVFAVKPEYKWLTFKKAGKLSVFFDDMAVKLASDNGVPFLVPVPPGSKTLKIQADCPFFNEAGFLTAGPKVARAVLYVPGQDATELVPLVYNEDGKQVGAVTLWAAPGEPWVVLFDCSTGLGQYFVYPANRKDNPARPNWVPEAGIVLETRYLDRFNPKVKTLAGFQELWKQSNFVAASMTQGDIWRSFLPCPPFHAGQPISKSVPRGAPLALCRYVGYLKLPGDDEYRFHFQTSAGGYVVVDGQTVIDLAPAEANAILAAPKNQHKIVAVKLMGGTHRLEVYQYGEFGQFHISLGWSTTTHKAPHVLGHDIFLLEPIASAVPSPKGAIENRDAAVTLASFKWYQSQAPGQECLGRWPADDIVIWHFQGQLTPSVKDAVFRWRFDDGHKAEGAEVSHIFLRSGMRQVTMEAVQDKTGKVLASRTQKIHVHPRWDWPESASFHPLVAVLKARGPEFVSVTPIEEVLSLHAWACQFRRDDLREVLGEAWKGRLKEAIGKCDDERLFQLGAALAEPVERRYDLAETVLRSAVAEAPPASILKKNSALALADLQVNVLGKSQMALELLNQVGAETPETELVAGWKFAPQFEPVSSVATTPLSQLVGKVTWQLVPEIKGVKDSAGKLPIRLGENNWLGLWLTKEIALPAKRQARPLVLELGRVLSESPFGFIGSPGMIWINGQSLGEPWRWRDGRVVVPAKAVQAGANQLVLFLETPAPLEQFPKNRRPFFEVHGPPGLGDIPSRWQRTRADVFLQLGKIDEARKALDSARVKAWPLDDGERIRLAAQLRSIRRLASGAGDDPENAIEQLDGLLQDYPLLRLDAEVMVVRVEAHVSRKEYQRAILLAEQMLKQKNQAETTRRQFLLAQIHATAELGQVEQARKLYKSLTDLSPLSPESARAREIIIRAVKTP